jgi:tetratricopeptide (TPR) repeat protein
MRGETEKAISIGDEIIEKHSNSDVSLRDLVNLYIWMKQYDKALNAGNVLVEKYSKDSLSFYYRSLVYYALGDYKNYYIEQINSMSLSKNITIDTWKSTVNGYRQYVGSTFPSYAKVGWWAKIGTVYMQSFGNQLDLGRHINKEGTKETYVWIENISALDGHIYRIDPVGVSQYTIIDISQEEGLK